MFSKRFFSTARANLSRSKVSQLSNGILIASKETSSPTSTIGLYARSGSRAENAYNSGVSSLLGRVLANSPQAQEGLIKGVEVTNTNSKEVTGLLASFESGNEDAAISTLTSIIGGLNTILKNESLVKEQAAISAKISELFENDPKKMVIEHMTATAFQGTSLALPTFGKSETVETLEALDVESFASKQLVNSNIAIIGSGANINHDKLAKLASELSLSAASKPSVEETSFLGSDVRLRDDTLPKAYVSISAKSVGLNDPKFFTALVASKIFGNFEGASSPFSVFESSKLSQFLNENHLVDSYEHFNLGYSDIGLWGAYLETSNIPNVDETVHFTLKNWNQLSTGTITETDVARAKSLLKLSLLSPVEDSKLTSTNLATDVLLKGHSESAAEIEQLVDSVSRSNVISFARDYLYDQDIALAGTGQIEALFDYNRIRNDMSSLRW
ncbi:unnamed protein product [[Candida] boidinii]|nr:hypothetical protein BVG19_g3931 [[Candida] boidinii]OWB51546.1 nucleobase-containing compound kinase activity protein [[Candida] boidinii]OWB69030.1 nucleobase-containing compound kinase activity protein [[Candida] boidinii]OWB86076.1 nucleobase-containing compound kinase activity protein [[Candida] boidinii]GME90059.1 unnamed protein product [[Candida] boidinii]